jgi:cytochrome c
MRAVVLAATTWLCAAVLAAQAPTTPLGIGRAATPEEIRALDIDAAPDGHGLPDGRGTAADGAPVYAAKCAGCHGAKGEGGSAERLVGLNTGGSFAYATDGKLIRTVGSYWPYATTLYDYTYRAMPFAEPGTLTPDQTYGVVAYLLSLNGLIAEGAVMDKTTLPRIVMPAHDHFVPDNRKGGPVVK